MDLFGSVGGDAAGKGSREDAEELPEVQVMNHVMRELLKNRKQTEPARYMYGVRRTWTPPGLCTSNVYVPSTYLPYLIGSCWELPLVVGSIVPNRTKRP